ncbi:tRNA 2-thiouridine(34) synthase MnmA [Neomegalonema perideroedes]|uniref:tRNA 2-thiouridine(34) synthase MnmA n=1 Tax=Neomegalonema perideroedes TaxID=217219 RepID=UPI00037D8A32|nr:tRNA 2-thiouridine(34) synthase MnmA [Neomegalonema perideroedes]
MNAFDPASAASEAPVSAPAPEVDLGFAPRPPSEVRVAAAMSGGVDSSVVAALLAKAGYDVVGLTMRLYDHGAALAKKGACCAGRDIYDARRVAEQSGFPHYVLDYENLFRQAVIEEFADAYLAGATPIPCVRCNQRVKFVDLMGLARELGAECLATGHYVRRIMGPNGPELHRAADPARDQSYFLFTTTREQLDYLRFPLGDRESKAETRAMALDLGLCVAEKPDSQDICFVPQGRYAAVVEKLRPGAASPGPIRHLDGRILGEHQGVIHFTIGQRKGLGIGGRAGEETEPLFVIRLDAEKREVVVGPREALATRRAPLREINWLGDGELADLPPEGVEILARVRSTRKPKPAILRATETGAPGTLEVELLEAEEGVAPGQACVFYATEGTRVLGGGWIARG